jgi:hypothetical protein
VSAEPPCAEATSASTKHGWPSPIFRAPTENARSRVTP